MMLKNSVKVLIVIALVFLVFLVASSLLGSSSTQLTQSSIQSSSTFEKKTPVPPDEIVSGGPPPDGIPSIDNPKFVAANRVDFLSDSDVVIGIHLNNEARAYPLLILVWHEIVNDVLEGKPLAITYCPLCYSSAAYAREINGQAVTFGTSGKLYNNNLVMYDRLTKSLWSEMWGRAIAGNLTGYTLRRVPSDLMPWGEWKKLYPNTTVLSRDTGYPRAYGSDPYGGYYTSSAIYFPLSHTDGRLSVKEIVLGLSVNDSNKAYPVRKFSEGAFSDSVGGANVVFFSITNGSARAFSPTLDGKQLHFRYSKGSFTDEETHSVWNYDGVALSGPLAGRNLVRFPSTTAFWFAWAAFYPDTEVYVAS